VLGGALGTDVLNLGGVVALTAGVAFQLYVASVNYARNAPEGYNAVKDVRVSLPDCLHGLFWERVGRVLTRLRCKCITTRVDSKHMMTRSGDHTP